MSPFTTAYGTSFPNVTSINIATFISGATTNPTPNGSSYARFQQIGSLVTVTFKYVFATTGTTGDMSINLPVPINATYTKPHSEAYVRYIGSSTGQVHLCLYNEKDVNSINIVSQNTFGSTPAAFTNLHPKVGLGAGDIISGVIVYETNN